MTTFQQMDTRLIPITQYVAPTTGQTVNVNTNGYVQLFINPAGTILALTIALPGSPSDGDRLTLGSSQIVTGLTMSGGTVIGALTSLAVASFADYVYNATAASWFRMG